MVGMERRTDVRAPVALMGAVQSTSGESPVVVLDISGGGVQLQADAPPDPEHEYQLHFSVHRMEYSPRFKVVRWSGADGVYQWGCCFSDLAEEDQENLRRSVNAAVGLAQTDVCDWATVLAAASAQPREQIVVGRTPSGSEIRLLGQDCLDIGETGVALFVETVAGLEGA